MELECAGAAVDSHHLAVGPAGGGVAGGDHGGDAVLAGDQGGVDGQGAPLVRPQPTLLRRRWSRVRAARLLV